MAGAQTPPRIVGGPGSGCIAGAVELPASGPGFETIRMSRSSFWGHPATIAALELLAREAQAAGLGTLYMNDISRPRGGPMAGLHASHMLGLDADVWLDVRPKPALTPGQRDAVEVESLVSADGRGVVPGLWSPAIAWLIRLATQLPGVDRVLVNPAIKRQLCLDAGADRGWLARVRPWYGHTAHMHIHFRCPPGQAECRDQSPVPGGGWLRRVARLVVCAVGSAGGPPCPVAAAGAAGCLQGDPCGRVMRRLGAAVFAAGFCTFVNLYAPQSLLPTLSADFGASAAKTGLVVTAPLIAVALMAPFVGGISDAFGRRRLIVPASLVLAVPTLLAGFSTNLDQLILLRFLQGLLLPFIFTVTVAYIADECPGAEGVRVTGIYSMGTIIGGFSGRFIAGWAAHFLGWRASFVVLAVVTIAAALLVTTLLPAERRFRSVRGWRSTLAGFVAQFGNKQVMATCGIGFAVLFSIVAAFTYANLLLAAPPYRLGPAELGSIFVTYLFGALIQPPAARLVIRYGRRRTAVLAGLVAGTGMLLTLAHPLFLIIIGLSLLAIGIFIEQMLSIGYVAVVADGSRSTAVGLYVTSYYVGGSLGGIAPAAIWSHVGWPGCVLLVLVVQFVAIAITWVVWPRGVALP